MIILCHTELFSPNQIRTELDVAVVFDKIQIISQKSNKLSRAAAELLSYGRSLYSSCEIIFQLYFHLHQNYQNWFSLLEDFVSQISPKNNFATRLRETN